MKKICLIVVLILSTILVLTACEVNNNDMNNEDSEQYNIYLLAKDSGFTGTYTDWLDSIKGADGKDGREIELSVVNDKIVWRYVGTEDWRLIYSVNDLIGPKGEAGKDGIDGVSITSTKINENGELIITFSDGKTTNVGKIVGNDGEAGNNGNDGLSISKAEINEKGELVLTYTNGTTANLGVVKGADGAAVLPQHNFINKCDDTYSWEECNKCGIIRNLHKHIYGNDNTCDTCGHVMSDCFSFTLLSDDTYSISSYYYTVCPTIRNLVIPSEYNGKAVTAIGDNAFSSNNHVISITIPSSIIHIGNGLFRMSNSLQSVVFEPNSKCTEMGNGAFAGCRSLTSINLPENLISIGSSSFAGCESITSIDLPQNLTSIGASAFSGTSLASIDLPKSLTSIGASAFRGCYFSSVVIPEKITRIENNVFNYCDVLESVVFDANSKCTSIGDGTFERCSALKHFDFPNQVTSIGSNAFNLCSALRSIVIPNGVTSIGDGAFSNCDELSCMRIPMSVINVDANAFDRSYKLDYVFYQGSDTNWNNITIGSGNSNLTNAYVEYESQTVSVTEKSNEKYNYIETNDGRIIVHEVLDKSIKTVDLAADFQGKQLIGMHNTFNGCGLLAIVKIPDSVSSIGFGTFKGCSALISFDISNNVKYLGDDVFEQCTSLSKVSLPNTIKVIRAGAFSGCESLIDISIPNSVTEIDDGAFDGCNSLTSINIPIGVTRVGYWAFWECNALTIYAEMKIWMSSWDSQWNPNNCPVVWYDCDGTDYTYTFDTKEGTIVEPITTKHLIDTAVIIPKRKGYTFEGWYDNPEYSGNVVAPYYYKQGGATLYAKWTPSV